MGNLLDRVSSDLRADEGWRPLPYKDHLGYLTIGYGFLIDPRKSRGMPLEVAEFWLRWEVEQRWGHLLERAPFLQDQHPDVQVALLNMSFQLGVNGVLNFRRMISSLRAGDRSGAAHHALDSVWATQTPQRAQRIASLIRG